MAGKRQRSNGTWEYVFKRKGVLSEPAYFTFDTEAEGDAYAVRAEALLDQGVVPPAMHAGGAVKTVSGLIEMYGASVRMARSEELLLPVMDSLVGKVRLEMITYTWVENWLESLHEAGKAPSTITKRVGALARIIDWAMRRNLVEMSANPLRLLPKGYGSAGMDRNKSWNGERCRRLEQAEEGAIRTVLTDKKEALLFDMALETAMRLREMVTLKVADIDLSARTVFLHATKNGSRRQIPMSSVLMEKLKVLPDTEYLFQDWYQGGDAKVKEALSNKLSKLFTKRFLKAGCADLHFHDLRHEATSRIYERTSLSDLEVASITGHKGFRMLQRYANLRGSNLAVKLW